MATSTAPPLTRPESLTRRLTEIADTWARSQYQLVVLSAEFADSVEWVLTGYPTAAHSLAHIADVEACTTREWIRIGRQLCDLPAIADAFANSQISYSKVRTLTRVAEPENETELLDIALDTPASELARRIAAWLNNNTDPKDLADRQHRQRSIKWRNEPNGMVTFTLRLPPLLAGTLIAILTTITMSTRRITQRHNHASADAWPTLAQQHCDALQHLLDTNTTSIDTEVVLHVRGDGCTLDDGTPIPDTIIQDLAPTSFLRALIHNADANPINASQRRRHPNTRQKRLVKERDQTCIDCGRKDMLEYDHNPSYHQTRHTITEELELRCAPCHHKRHQPS